MRRILYFFPIVFLFTACEVEFSPNAEWKNIPAVYCLLDQDDDTTWVRVQRCYLTNGNIYEYGQVSDSINYPQGTVSVSLLAYKDGVLKDSMAFNYVERNIDSGLFAHRAQPLYWYETRSRLKEDYEYVLTVRNVADNTVLATTDPISLIKKTAESLITKPTVTVLNGNDTVGGGLSFYDHLGGDNSNYCHIKWNPLDNARRYQPVVRFYYEEQGVTMHVDLKCPSVSAKYNETYFSRDLFLSQLQMQLQADTARKRYIPQVDLYLTCCSEDLNAYLSTVTSGSAISQNTDVYNNIRGGVGVFAARRTHLFKRMPCYNSDIDGRGLYYFLVNLGVGLY